MTHGTEQGGGAPPPTTGHALPVYNDEVDERCATGLEEFGELYIPYERQEAIRSRINTLRLMSINKRGREGIALPGRELSQVSQAGKSKVLQAYALEMQRGPNTKGDINPYRVIYVGLEVRQTLKMLCKKILKLLGDPHWDLGNADDVRERLREFMRFRDVELLIIDEVQHLKGHSNDKVDITDELKRFLDSGIVPVVFAGNEEARDFFASNVQLAARLGDPLELTPLSAKATDDKKLFRQFCIDLDEEMRAAGICRQPSGFGKAGILTGLMKSSGGHVGRVCRIVEVALEHALRRDADMVEAYDLHHAVDAFAISKGYCQKNAFAC